MRAVFKIALFKEFGTQANAAKVLEIKAPNLSALVRGHRGSDNRRASQAAQSFLGLSAEKFFPKAASCEGAGHGGCCQRVEMRSAESC